MSSPNTEELLDMLREVGDPKKVTSSTNEIGDAVVVFPDGLEIANFGPASMEMNEQLAYFLADRIVDCAYND